jgi:hypothetical protein
MKGTLAKQDYIINILSIISVGSLTSHNHIGLQGLLRDSFTLLISVVWRIKEMTELVSGMPAPQFGDESS